MQIKCLNYHVRALAWVLIGAFAASIQAQRTPQTYFDDVNENKATPVDRIKVPDGFKVELLYSVPGKQQGSWVNLSVDPKGRIIASDQFGSLYRLTPPPAGQTLQVADIETVPADIRAVNGMLWVGDALYVGVNDYERKIESGLYRLTDSDGDDMLDQVEKLRGMDARGDHGVHAIVMAPTGDALFIVTGNGTTPTEFSDSRVPTIWGEDHLLPRMPDGRGHNRGVLAPGGIIYKVSLDGKDWEIYSSGYRNIFDAAFNREGELFTYDADMEYDFNTPWYRPTRINLVTSGSEYGWRNGTGKRPEWYPDNLPPVVNIGPGSPTGVTFGHGAAFPAKYQNALYALDWSWGKIFAVHLKPEGSGYVAVKEEWVSGTPLPVTDAVIHPKDGAMYFAIGGRRVQSGLYRVTYHGDESTAPAQQREGEADLEKRRVRYRLEGLHGEVKPWAAKSAWPHLDHPDRFTRWAARTVLEHQPAANWQDKALQEPDHGKRVEALLGLARLTGVDPFHRDSTDHVVDIAMRGRLLHSLNEVDWDSLSHEQKLAWLRTYQIVLNRFERPGDVEVEAVLARLDGLFPTNDFQLNTLLCETLVYLQSSSVAEKAIGLLVDAPTQEEQMEYARSLRMLKEGWSMPLRRVYFEWFLKASNYRGGASFSKFLEFIRDDALKTLTDQEKTQLATLLEKQPEKMSPLQAMAKALQGRQFVKEWELAELSVASKELKNRNFQNGRKAFGAAGCFACHRFGNEGGMTGPDLTAAGGRYTAHDFLDQIIDPNKEINEQFVPIILTKTDGETVTGVIVNLSGNGVQVNTDPADPYQRVTVDRREVESIAPSDISPMPAGLLNLLEKEEIMDLVAYVLSGGEESNPMFR